MSDFDKSSSQAPTSSAQTLINTPQTNRPPWVAMVVTYLVITSSAELLKFCLGIWSILNLVYAIPPFCFVSWYAWESTSELLSSIGGFLRWFVPALGLICARRMWKQPGLAPRLTYLIATVLVVQWLFVELAGFFRYWRGDVWEKTLRVSLSAHEIWIPLIGAVCIWARARIRRPEVALLTLFFVASGFHVVQALTFRFITLPFYLVWSPYDSFAEKALLIGDSFCGVLLILSGLALLRRNPPIGLACGILLLKGSILAGGLAHDVFARAGARHWRFIAMDCVGLLVLGTMLIAIRRFAVRNKHVLLGTTDPLCRRCGYNLTGNTSGRCPECGTTLNTDTPDQRTM